MLEDPHPHSISKRAILTSAIPIISVGVVFVYLYCEHPLILHTHQYLIGPVAILAGGLTAIITGLNYTLHSTKVQTHNSKVKAAHDTISKKMWDKDYIAARERFIALTTNKADLSIFLSFEDNSLSEADAKEHKLNADAIRNIVNDHELTAISIRQNVIDEDFIKLWHKTSMIREFSELKPFIIAVRQQVGNNRIYCEYEELLKKWEDEDKTSA